MEDDGSVLGHRNIFCLYFPLFSARGIFRKKSGKKNCAKLFDKYIFIFFFELFTENFLKGLLRRPETFRKKIIDYSIRNWENNFTFTFFQKKNCWKFFEKFKNFNFFDFFTEEVLKAFWKEIGKTKKNIKLFLRYF